MWGSGRVVSFSGRTKRHLVIISSPLGADVEQVIIVNFIGMENAVSARTRKQNLLNEKVKPFRR